MQPVASRSLLVVCVALSLVKLAGAQTVPTPSLVGSTPFLTSRISIFDLQTQALTPTPSTVSRKDFAEKATQQIGLLSSLRTWRDTLRGAGASPRRDFASGSVGGQVAKFSLGNVAPPMVGAGAGMAAKWSGFEVGSTWRPAALDKALLSFDQSMSDSKLVAPDQTQITWIRATPLATKDANIEFSLSRGQRDMLAGVGEKWVGGSFANAKTSFKLPSKWSMQGNFTRAQMNDQDAAATSWGVNASGPIEHPWGVAQATANWQSTETGFATLVNPAVAAGGSNGGVALAQDIAAGTVTGHLGVAATMVEALAPTQTTDTNTTQTDAKMRVAVTPTLALTASGTMQVNSTVIAPVVATPASTDAATDSAATDAPVADALATPSEIRAQNNSLSGDIGVEMKLSKALSIAVSTGTAQVHQRNGLGDDWSDGASSGESHHAIEMRHKTSAADLRLRLSQRARNSDNTSVASQSDLSMWRIEASRRIVGDIKLKTIVDLAHDAEANVNARRYEAQFNFSKAARLDARYREGNLPLDLISDEFGSAFGSPNSVLTRQWSARFNAGSAASGAGLGLALEYARTDGSDDTWKIGLQYK